MQVPGEHRVGQVGLLPGLEAFRRTGVAAGRAGIPIAVVQPGHLGPGHACAGPEIRGQVGPGQGKVAVEIDAQGHAFQRIDRGFDMAPARRGRASGDRRPIEQAVAPEPVFKVACLPTSGRFDADVINPVTEGELERAALIGIEIVDPAVPVEGQTGAGIGRVAGGVPVRPGLAQSAILLSPPAALTYQPACPDPPAAATVVNSASISACVRNPAWLRPVSIGSSPCSCFARPRSGRRPDR